MSEQSAMEDDRLSQILWRRGAGKVLVRREQFAPAERLARDAVEVAGTTEYLDYRAGALMDLAEVLILVKRRQEASRVSGEALRLIRGQSERRRHTTSEGTTLQPVGRVLNQTATEPVIHRRARARTTRSRRLITTTTSPPGPAADAPARQPLPATHTAAPRARRRLDRSRRHAGRPGKSPSDPSNATRTPRRPPTQRITV